MTTAGPPGEAIDGAVELLERALALTCTALGGVDETPGGHLRAPTPCAGWSLEQLLDHMDDALDAFTEAAAGVVAVRRPVRRPEPAAPGGSSRVESLRGKASVLLGAWLGAPAGQVRVGEAAMRAPLLVATAALEITVHGWDVARATGSGLRIPTDLATGLLPLARTLVEPADRVTRFAPPLVSPGDPAPDELLLAFLGRIPPTPPGSHRAWRPERVRAAG